MRMNRSVGICWSAFGVALGITVALASCGSASTSTRQASPSHGIETVAASAATSTVPSLTTSSESTAIATVTTAAAAEPNVPPAISVLRSSPPVQTTTLTSATQPSTVVPSQLAKPTADDAMAAVQASFTSSGSSPVTRLGFNADHTVVVVAIRADHMAFALDLKAKYGDAIELTIGEFPYPPEIPPGRNRCGPPMLQPSAATLGLTATATVAASTLRSGADGTGTVIITNNSNAALTIETDSGFTGYLTDSQGAIIGVFSLGFAGTGRGWTVAPGASETLGVEFGTTSCDPQYGYSLPAGTYNLVVPVRIQVGANLTEVLIRTAPIPITVTA